ncbi:MAG TPA: secretin and TonB N-terminal domain-containing protein [Thermoanaerobaculia bacterium]|nr:secretin and TonB N-terminal domain-containing protein [Thermoanaerobaculia bacterium]
MSIARRISLACGFALLTLASCCTTAVTAEEPQSAKEPATEADSATAPTEATPDEPTATPAEPVPVETTATPVMPVTVVTPRGVEGEDANGARPGSPAAGQSAAKPGKPAAAADTIAARERPRAVSLGRYGEIELGRPPQAASRWKGFPISLSLRDAPLPEVLRSFARIAGVNLVLAPGVTGSVTVELQDVPWDQALSVILKTHGMAAEIDGRVWLVEPY